MGDLRLGSATPPCIAPRTNPANVCSQKTFRLNGANTDLIRGSLDTQPSPQTNRRVDRFIRFRNARGCAQQTAQPDHATHVARGGIFALHACDAA